MPIRIDRHASPLGRWLLARWAPGRLAGVVEGIWYFEGWLSQLRERHFPHGRLELVVQLGPLYKEVVGDRTSPFSPTCISGLRLGPDVIEAPPEPCVVLGVRLHPADAFAVLGRPLHELCDLTADLDDVVPEAAGSSAPPEAAGAQMDRRPRGDLPMPKTAEPIPEGYHTVTPYLMPEDADPLIRFLQEGFDAELLARHDGPDGRMMHAALQIGDSKVMMGQATDQWPAMPAMLHLYVEDVDALFRRAIAAGGRAIREPEDQFYGDRSGGLVDPAGNQWWVTTHIEDVSPEELERRMAGLQG